MAKCIRIAFYNKHANKHNKNITTFVKDSWKLSVFLLLKPIAGVLRIFKSKHSTLFRDFMWVVFTFATTHLGFSVVAIVSATSFNSTLKKCPSGLMLFLLLLVILLLLLHPITVLLCETLRAAYKYARNAIYPIIATAQCESVCLHW